MVVAWDVLNSLETLIELAGGEFHEICLWRCWGQRRVVSEKRSLVSMRRLRRGRGYVAGCTQGLLDTGFLFAALFATQPGLQRIQEDAGARRHQAAAREHGPSGHGRRAPVWQDGGQLAFAHMGFGEVIMDQRNAG